LKKFLKIPENHLTTARKCGIIEENKLRRKNMFKIYIVMLEQHPAVAFYVQDEITALAVAKLLFFDSNVLAVSVEDSNGKILLEM
jgi:hypothetical protein